MSIGAIIQARMSSVRAPGKVLREVGGKPLLSYLVDRLRRSRSIDQIILATSQAPSDDVLKIFSARNGLDCFRGDLSNVASRFAGAIEKFNLPSFIRLSGDSPLLDPNLIDQLVEVFSQGKWDLVTNVQRRTFPKGQSVEIVRSDFYLNGFRQMSSELEKEHVTPFFYGKADLSRIYNYENPDHSDFSAVNLSVDTEDDFSFFALLVERFPNIGAMGWRELVSIKESLTAGSIPKR